MTLKPGDAAPVFEARDGDGVLHRLDDYRGRKLLLYFYPMDDTPGCTAQACALRDDAAALHALDVAVLGVSAQNAASHRSFGTKHELNFPLLADTDRRIAEAYGALGDGLGRLLRSRLGFYRRISYLIDERGHIAHVFERAETAGHPAQVKAVLASSARLQ